MNQQENPSFSIKKRINSFKYAINGLKIILSTQHNFLIHLIVAVLVTAAGLFFKVSDIEWCILILTMAMVLGAEAFNTSIEKLTDLVSPDYNAQAGKVKDLAAAAVLIAAIASIIIGLTIFLPKALSHINGL